MSRRQWEWAGGRGLFATEWNGMGIRYWAKRQRQGNAHLLTIEVTWENPHARYSPHKRMLYRTINYPASKGAAVVVERVVQQWWASCVAARLTSRVEYRTNPLAQVPA